MEYQTTITQKWQMTLPKSVRQMLKIKKPGKVLISVVDKKKGLIKVQKTADFLDLAGSLPLKNSKGKKINVLKAREYMEKNYERV